MRIFLTGATGFIGGALANRCLAEGHELDLLVRTPAKAKDLEQKGARLHPGDVVDRESVLAAMKGADAVVHAAALYKLGPVDRVAMQRTNVEGTRHVLEAARDLGIPRIVYVSSVAAKGETSGEIADERFEHQGRYCSWYEWTKHKAHLLARELRHQGLPVRIVMPGVVYGPGDPSAIGRYIRDYVARRLPARIGEETIYSFVHVDDVVDGILRVIERGEDGEEYLLSGIPYSFKELHRILEELTGVRPPWFKLPIPVARVYAFGAEFLGRLTGIEPLVTQEGVTSMDSACFAFSSLKAIEELGWPPRDLPDGLRQTLQAEGRAVR